jgi:hypothetical protein
MDVLRRQRGELVRLIEILLQNCDAVIEAAKRREEGKPTRGDQKSERVSAVTPSI